MKNSLYFAAFEEKTLPAPCLRLGFGFDGAGSLVRPAALPENCAGIVVHDMAPPSERGAEEFADYVNQMALPVVCDFERPAQPVWESLLARLPAELLTVPEQYAHCPHAAVLTAPYLPAQPFDRWLEEKRSRFGKIVLDLSPLSCALRCGTREFYAQTPPPGPAGKSSALHCLCAAALEDGAPTLYFFDDRETLNERQSAADAPGVVLLQEYPRQ